MSDVSNGMAGRRALTPLPSFGILAAAYGAIIAIVATFVAGIPSPKAAETTSAIADFTGYWIRPEPAAAAMLFPPDSGPGPIVFAAEAGEMRRGMPMIGDHTNPILLPHAAAAVRAQVDHYRTGEIIWSAWALCWPPGVPLAFSMVEPVQFLQTKDQITILYQRGQTVRRVDLNQRHPPSPALSWYGHSIGHYEGADTLVIDTIAQDPRSAVDRFGTPKSEAMRIVERYTLSADGQSLNVDFTVEDPKTFATAWSAKVGYVKIPPRSGDEPQEPEFAEIICPENNRDPEGGGFAIPIAATPDF